MRRNNTYENDNPSTKVITGKTAKALNKLVKTTIVHFKKISNQVLVLKSMKIREIWTTKYIEWLVRTRQIVL